MIITIVGLLVTAACTTDRVSPTEVGPSSTRHAPSTSVEIEPPSPDAPSATDETAALVRGGLTVVASEADLTTVHPGEIVVTKVSARRLLAEAAAGGGIPGADLDAYVPLPTDSPALSYFIAAWITTGQTAGAELSRTWMGNQEWPHSSKIVFPQAVVAMFVTDALAHSPSSSTSSTTVS